MKNIAEIVTELFSSKIGDVFVAGVTSITLHNNPLCVELPDGIDFNVLVKLMNTLNENGYEAKHITSTIMGSPTINSSINNTFSIRARSAIMIPIIDIATDRR